MLRCVHRPEVYFDLIGLQDRGLVTVGRESESLIRLDSPAVPYLLSRKHGTLTFNEDGTVILKDLNSTNGTYVARQHEQLRKLSRDTPWVLQTSDTISFGGPEQILVEGIWVPNPFVFYFYPIDTELVDECLTQEEANEQLMTGNDQAPRPALPNERDVLGQQSRDQSSGGDDTEAAEVGTSGRGATSPNGLEGNGVLRRSCCNKENKEAGVPHSGSQKSGQMTPTGKKMKEILHSHLTCPICQEWLLATHALPCGHMFCGLCLATWLQHRRSCPTCRKRVAGVPVRCFQVDGTINDVLAVGVMSPSTKLDRKRKQESWEEIQESIALDWLASLKNRKQRAMEEAIAHHAQFQAGHVVGGPTAGLEAAAQVQPSAGGDAQAEMDGLAGGPAGRAPTFVVQTHAHAD